MQTCVKILKFTLNFNFFFPTRFDRHGDHQKLRKFPLKTAALPSVNAILEYALVHAPLYCTSVICNSDCVSISCIEYIDVSCIVGGCVFVVLSYAALMSVYGVGPLLFSFLF
jgi:hypothetical protein